MEEKLEIIKDYINTYVEIGDKCNAIIDNCVDLIHMQLPRDDVFVFERINDIVSASEDLSYVILCIKRFKIKKEQELRSLKDPKFTILVRGNRPSTQAIESEIRMTVPEVAEIEQELMNIDNILDYLYHIEKSLDRYIWLLKDFTASIKK